MNLVVYRNYTGSACVDHPTTTYSYRYNAIVSDAHSELKYSKCSSTGNITIERKNLTGTLKTAGVSELACSKLLKSHIRLVIMLRTVIRIKNKMEDI